MKKFWKYFDLVAYHIWYPIRDFCMWPVDKAIERFKKRKEN